MTIDNFNFAGKKAFVRVDFNVPLDKKTGEITDDKRIKGALPTIKYLVDNKAKVILVSHLGRPKNGPEPAFSMKPAADRLAELIGQLVDPELSVGHFRLGGLTVDGVQGLTCIDDLTGGDIDLLYGAALGQGNGGGFLGHCGAAAGHLALNGADRSIFREYLAGLIAAGEKAI